MHALQDEELVSLADASRLASKMGVRRLHPSTLWRWCRKGIRGERLEYLRVGRRIVTSREALLRFFAAVAATDQILTDDPARRVNRQPESDRDGAFERALQELDEAGV